MSYVVPGVARTIAQLRERGLKIGSTTGYTRDLTSVVSAVTREEGLDVETVLTADDVPAGRRAPWMIFQAAQQLGVYPMWQVVTVDDTMGVFQRHKTSHSVPRPKDDLAGALLVA